MKRRRPGDTVSGLGDANRGVEFLATKAAVSERDGARRQTPQVAGSVPPGGAALGLCDHRLGDAVEPDLRCQHLAFDPLRVPLEDVLL